MSDDDAQKAIDAALKNDWQKALDLNTKINKEHPEDTECLNRLGKAYLELGQVKKATQTFKEVLKINPYDPIATKNLLRASQTPASKANGKAKAPTPLTSTNISFLEEPGKTKIVALVNVAPTKTLLSVQCADCVILISKRHSILIESANGTYLGALPDDLGHRLLVLIKGGNEYEAFVKSVGKGLLTIFMKEKVRSKRFKNTPSFPSGSTDYLSFVRDDGHSEETKATGTQDEDEGDGDEITFKKSQSLHEDEMPEES